MSSLSINCVLKHEFVRNLIGMEIEKYLRLESVNDLSLRVLPKNDSKYNSRVIAFHFLSYCI